MVEATIRYARYTYTHDNRASLQALDTHSVVVRRNAAMKFFANLSGLLLVANPFLLFLRKDKSTTILLWSLLVVALLIKLSRKPVEKESVVIMPTFGVQLETHYRSGRKVRQFIPMSKILKLVLNECVTPATCYWSLSLIVRGEEELVLVFKELHPPLRMLVPIRKALCAAVDTRENTGSSPQDYE